MRVQDVGYAELATEMPEVLRCSWHRRGSVPQGANATVLPDACADVVVDQFGAAVLVGPTMAPHRLELEPSVVLRGLRLQPWAIPLLFRTTANELRDQVLSLGDLLGSRLARQVTHDVWRGRVPSCWRTVDTTPWQMNLVKSLLHASGGVIEHTGRSLGVSEREARRTARRLTGLSPRDLAQVGRLHRLLPLIDHSDHPLAVVAVDAGFTDQAHMTRVLKLLTGTTPRSLRDERAGVDAWSADRILAEVADLLTGA
ncbi:MULTISPECIES: helix-turn-helix domain-containing protein [Protofrankia]|uniref:Helix-turn-helix, AraC domain protein n=1 Tax=Candidatus Protofrankia datiscae TaxID=2716812 RepID=F8B2C0_9ACTN|nr:MULTISPECIES: helix-turn-helix domain-containing protein [Protofrankia]AEH10797.1 Helix-turn-helix, AraC domain protein [Candidatus Protofrankia datiscae]